MARIIIIISLLMIVEDTICQNHQCIIAGRITVEGESPQEGTLIELLRSDDSYIRTAYYDGGKGRYGVSALSSDGLMDGDSLKFRVTAETIIENPDAHGKSKVEHITFIARHTGDKPVFEGGFPPTLKTIDLFKNQSPESFSLITPTDTTSVDSVIVFQWEESEDPDKDEVLYTLNIFSEDTLVYKIENITDTLYALPIDNISLNTKYRWNVIATDGYDITTSNETLSFIVLVVGVDEPAKENHVINSFRLYQNYPNPFNPSTTIQFTVPKIKGIVGTSSETKLVIYNSLGQLVKELINRHLQAGYYSITFESNNLPTGVYYYKLTVGNLNQVKKMILIK